MTDHSAQESCFTLSHLVLITGLNDRTLRNYLRSGILEGEKKNGIWCFTPEQVQALITHPAVRPTIMAKNNALVYDFLLDEHKRQPESCIILDFPGESRTELSQYFCNAINEGDYHHIHFSFDGVFTVPRVILKGDTADVLALVNGYYQSKQTK